MRQFNHERPLEENIGTVCLGIFAKMYEKPYEHHKSGNDSEK